MRERMPGQLDVLLVVASEPLARRVSPLLSEWKLSFARVEEGEALAQVRLGVSRVVVCEVSEGRRPSFEELRASGAVPVLLLSTKADTPPDVEIATTPEDLVSAIFRAQGRLASEEAGSLELVNRFSQAIATQFTLPELVQEAIAKTRELCEADGASLVLVDRATGELCFDVVSGTAAGALRHVRLPKGQGVAGRVALDALPRLVPVAAECPDFDASMDQRSGFQTGSIVGAPLVLSGDVLGVLMAVRAATSPPFLPRHLERLVALAPHVAIAVHHAQVTQALRTSQSEVMQINASLEQKVQERTVQISRAKQEWERTFDAIEDPIVLLDGFVIRRANLAYARRVAERIQALPGRNCHEVLARRKTPCPGCPLLVGRSAALRAELGFGEVGEARRAILQFNGYWMSDDPDSQAVVVHYQDVTQARSLEDRLRETERLAAVGQLASGAAHEINNPLGFVTSNLRSLRGLIDEVKGTLEGLGGQTESLDDGLEMIDESLDGARRVGDIVKGLRELSRLEIGRREAACVNASVTRMVRKELGEALGSNVVLELKATRQADVPPLQLDQAIGHILRNAKQAVHGPQRIIVRTSSTEREVTVEIADEGAGIVRENLRRVFEPFFTTRGIGKGIGLGLTAAYGIVKRAGGELAAESPGPGKGATLTMRLPAVAGGTAAKVA